MRCGRTTVAMRWHPKTVAYMMIIAATALLFLPASSMAATTDKTVQGTISDQNGDPVSGASVRVEIWGGSWPDQDFFRTSATTVSNAYGDYQVTINSNYWDPHNTIKVIATFDGYGGSHSVEANDQQYQTVDVTVRLIVPEFGDSPGMLVIVIAFIALSIALSTQRRRHFR